MSGGQTMRKRLGYLAKPPQRVRIGRWHGAENSRLPVEHDVGSRHTCQQGDLGVPALDRFWRPEGERPAIALLLNLLLRNLQAHSAAIAFSDLAPLSDQLQQSQGLPRQASVHLGLSLAVAELRPAPHEGPRHIRRHGLAAVVERDRPQQCRPYLIGNRLAAPSLSTGGCSGVRRSGAYSVVPRRCASMSIGSPGRTKAATSAIA